MSAHAREAPTVLQEQFRQAYQHHKAGSLEEAERGGRQLRMSELQHWLKRLVAVFSVH